MVKTRSDLKLKIREWVNQQEQPFTSRDVCNYSSKIAPNIFLSPQRVAKYLPIKDINCKNGIWNKINVSSGVIINADKKQRRL